MELRLKIMHEIPDLLTLSKLVTADPSMVYKLRTAPRKILPAVLARSMPLERQIPLYMFLMIREAG